MGAAAEHRVTIAHAAAAKKKDPVAAMREAQAEAEATYARTGRKSDLAIVRAFERSLDGDA